MSSIGTTVCAATNISVEAVKFLKDPNDQSTVFAVQRVYITTHDGNRMELTLHLNEGCTALATGEAIALPTPAEVAA